MKANIKTMQDLAAIFPDIYREHKLLCHAQKKARSVVITVIDKHNISFQVTGGTIDKAYENLMYWVKNHETIINKRRQTMRKRKLKRYDEMKATSLNAEQINALIEVLAIAKTNVANYMNTKYEIFGICAQEQIDAAIELLYEEDETKWRR